MKLGERVQRRRGRVRRCPRGLNSEMRSSFQRGCRSDLGCLVFGKNLSRFIHTAIDYSNEERLLEQYFVGE